VEFVPRPGASAVTRLPFAPPGKLGQVSLVTSRVSIGLGFVSSDDQGRVTVAFDTSPELTGS